MIKQNYSVKTILRKDKKRKDGTCPIYYQVIINSVTLKLPSGEYCEESKWNAQDGCLKGSKSSHENCALDYGMTRIKKFIWEQRAIGTHLDIELVKSFFSTNDNDDFYEFYDNFCKKKFLDLKEGTQEHYLILRRRLKSFKNDIKLSQINLKFIENFDAFLRIKLSTGDSGVWSRHKNLKAVLGFAYKNKRINKNPYDDFKLTQTTPEIIPLTTTELRLIEKIKFSSFPKGKGHQISRDMFLFSSFCGLRFSDVTKLKKENIINGESISIKMQKTSKFVNVPLTEKAKIILAKYISHNNETIFPKRSNECVNRDLKDIASLCKIKKNVHFHLARHTFASILANSDVNAFKIMQSMGHSDVRVTQRYVNSSIEDLSKMFSKISAFN